MTETETELFNAIFKHLNSNELAIANDLAELSARAQREIEYDGFKMELAIGDSIVMGNNIICSSCEENEATQYYDGDALCPHCLNLAIALDMTYEALEKKNTG